MHSSRVEQSPGASSLMLGALRKNSSGASTAGRFVQLPLGHKGTFLAQQQKIPGTIFLGPVKKKKKSQERKPQSMLAICLQAQLYQLGPPKAPSTEALTPAPAAAPPGCSAPERNASEGPDSIQKSCHNPQHPNDPTTNSTEKTRSIRDTSASCKKKSHTETAAQVSEGLNSAQIPARVSTKSPPGILPRFLPETAFLRFLLLKSAGKC